MHAAILGGARLGKKIVILVRATSCHAREGHKSLGASEIVVVDMLDKRLGRQNSLEQNT